MKITTDEEYEAILKRVVKGAEYLENPLITEEDKRKGMKLFDELWKIAREYRLSCSDSGESVRERTGSSQKVAV